MKHHHIYKLLIAAGHCPGKAAEIILNAQRGQLRARQWIGAILEASPCPHGVNECSLLGSKSFSRLRLGFFSAHSAGRFFSLPLEL